MSLKLLFFVWLFHEATLTSSQTCNNARSCFSQTVSQSDSHIQCYGYRSCEQSPSIESTGSGRIYCQGSYSCYNAVSIKRTSSSDGNEIQCVGLFACANTGVILNNNGAIACHGEQSCTNTKLILLSNSRLRCSGDRSCSNSEVISRQQNLIAGRMAGMNSKFYSNDSAVEYYFRGSYAGYNATVICGDGHICTIECDGNACNELSSYECSGGGTGCNWYLDCSSSQKNSICPNGKIQKIK